MRTNIVLDDDLVDEAMHFSHVKTKREVVDLALRELVARHRQRQLKRLKGRQLIDDDYDIRRVRQGMNRGIG